MQTTQQNIQDSLQRIGFSQVSVVELAHNRFRIVGRVDNLNDVAIVMASARTVAGAPIVINGLFAQSPMPSATNQESHSKTNRGSKLETSSR